MPPIQDPIERLKSLQSRAKKAEEALEANNRAAAIAEDRLKTAQAEAKKEFGSDDPIKLDKLAADNLSDANAAMTEADTILTAAGF